MTEFNDTGLPADNTVFSAYRTYLENIKTLPGALNDGFPVRVAKVLADTQAGEPSAVALPLLALSMPPGTWGAIERRFGADMLKRVEEFHLHNHTGNAYIDEASKEVQTMNLAAAIVTFDDFRTAFERARDALQEIRERGEPADINMQLPLIPSIQPFNHLHDATENKTGCPALEELYAERLFAFIPVFEEYQDLMQKLGVELPGMGAERDADGGFRYPSFEEAGLTDDARVRAAYKELTTNPLVQPEDFEAAAATARILSETQNPNPVAVAVSLLYIGLPDMNGDDLKFLEKRVDADVVEMIAAAGISMIGSGKDVLETPPAMRQVITAFHTASLTDAALGARDFAEFAEMKGDQIPPQAIRENIEIFRELAMATMQIMRGVPGNTGAPDLDDKFVAALRELNTVTAELEEKFLPKPAPKSRLALAPPPAKKPGVSAPKPSDGSFDL